MRDERGPVTLPPRWADALLRRFLPEGELGLSIIGDLHQEFEETRHRGRFSFPRLRYWRDALGLSARYLTAGIGAKVSGSRDLGSGRVTPTTALLADCIARRVPGLSQLQFDDGRDLTGLGDLLEQEEEPGLGNGGLGRLAACYMDSLATLEIPAIGYGIRYEFGIFDQEIRDGWQVEITDKWLHLGNPWEISRPELAATVKFGGHTEAYYDDHGEYGVRWIPDRVVNGIPYDTPVLGYKVNTCNMLRLWKTEACESFDFQALTSGTITAP